MGQMEDDGADVDVAEEVAFVAYTIQNKACRVAHHTSTIRCGKGKKGGNTHIVSLPDLGRLHLSRHGWRWRRHPSCWMCS